MIRKLTAVTAAAAIAFMLLPSGALAAPVRVRLDPSEASPFNNGEFEGWGTSMGWWGNRIGYSDKMSQQAAEDLYSENGLSLDIVRYNVGGGDNPSHNHITRSDSKLPCFAEPKYTDGEFSEDGNGDINFERDENGGVIYDYNWDNDYNQVNVLTRIKEQNPDVHIEGYTNSPPWFMTNSKCSSGGVGAAENLDPENYDIFVDFLADVTEHMDEKGLHFDSYSPMNEPNPKTAYWGAMSPKQEGNHVAQGEHQSALIKALKDEYISRGIDTLVAGPDETDIGYSINAFNALTDEAKAALDRLDTHTYGGSNRVGLKRTAFEGGKNLWMSEVDGGWNGFALADRIITDLNGMQASAWVMWDIVDFHRDADFVDPTTGNKTEANNTLNPAGGLWGVGMGNHDTETIEWANKYYAFGQFTKYINPGDTLIASSDKSLAAYNKKTGDIKIVVNNSSASDTQYEFDLTAFRNIGNTVTQIRSNNLTGDAAEHWKNIEGEASVENKILTATAKAGTITTYIIKGNGEARYAVINGGDGDLLIGGTAQLTLDTDISGDTEWSVDNQAVAMIDGNGLLTIKKSGTVTVTAKTDGFAVTKTIAIPLEISGGGTELSIGDTVNMRCNVAEGYDGNVEWSVDNADVAQITDGGLLTIKKSGSVTVTVTVADERASKTFEIPEYKLSGTASWGNDSNLPKDSDDYRKAADGDFTTFFDGNKDGWIMYDFGAPYRLSSVKLAAREGYTARTVGAKIQGSHDGIEWTDIYTITSAVPAGEYTAINGDWSAPPVYRYYRYTNSADMTNIAEFIIEGEVAKIAAEPVVTEYKADKNGMSYSYELPEEYEDAGVFFAVYDREGVLRYVSLNRASDSAEGDFSDSTHRLYVWDDNMRPLLPSGYDEDAPEVRDISEFTDNFERGANIFGAPDGKLADNGNQIYASGLERFGNVFMPVRDTGTVTLPEPIVLTDKDRFRIKFNMFAGWEDGGRDNIFALRDADGNEIAAIYITGGGYTLQEIRVGGENVLAGTAVAQCRSNAGANKAGANGWNNSGQPYRNNMGINKTAEIIIDGTGQVKVSFTGGIADTVCEGVIRRGEPITIASMEVAGDFNTSRERVAAYDNFDADVISYPSPLPKPPAPTPPPELPEDGTLISLDFNNGDLTSGSPYGKAEGNPVIEDTDGRKAARFSNSASDAIKLTDANGGGLLAGQDEITVSFSFKQTNDGTSWWFYAASNDSAQTYASEHYIGALGKAGGTLSIERYHNGRSETADSPFTLNEWHDAVISFAKNETVLYVDGKQINGVPSSFKISDMLGASGAVYIGRANWGTGEYATGYIDDFVIKSGALKSALDDIDLGDTAAVTSDLTLPADGGITWSSSDETVIDSSGRVTRQDESKTVTLTASVTENNIPFTKTFDVTVKGYLAAADSFTAYAENGTIYYTSDYGADEKYGLTVTVTGADGDNTTYINQFENQGSGKIENAGKGTYKISYILHSEPEKIVTKTVSVKDEIETSAYLFAHFMNTEGDADDEQIYFSVSEDGTSWTTINGGKPILISEVGTKGVRDPYILRGEDGKFFIIATDLSIYNLGITQGGNKWGYSQTNGSRSIVVWESDDLVNWSEANLVEAGVADAGCVWAPEAVYDPEKGMYMVFWASKTASDNYSTQRMYRSYTSDFKTFTEPEIYIDGGNISNIDTTIVSDKGVYYRFTKNESKSTVTMMKANFLDGPWTDVKTYTLGDMTGYEGPAVYKNNGGGWTMLLDFYSKSQGYKPFVTDDIAVGDFKAAADFKFDGTYRHGTVMPITKAEYDALIEKYGN